jgi:hypothetical protein
MKTKKAKTDRNRVKRSTPDEWEALLDLVRAKLAEGVGMVRLARCAAS